MTNQEPIIEFAGEAQEVGVTIMSFNQRLDVSVPGLTSGPIGNLVRRGAKFELGDEGDAMTGREALEELARRMFKVLGDKQAEREADNSDDENSMGTSREDIRTRTAAILARRLDRRAQSALDWGA